MFVLCLMCITSGTFSAICLHMTDDAHFKTPTVQIRQSNQSSFTLVAHLKKIYLLYILNLDILFDLIPTVFFIVKNTADKETTVNVCT